MTATQFHTPHSKLKKVPRLLKSVGLFVYDYALQWLRCCLFAGKRKTIGALLTGRVTFMGTNADMVKGAIIAAVTMIQALFYGTMHTPVNVFHTQTPFMRCVPLYGTFIVYPVPDRFMHYRHHCHAGQLPYDFYRYPNPAHNPLLPDFPTYPSLPGHHGQTIQCGHPDCTLQLPE